MNKNFKVGIINIPHKSSAPYFIALFKARIGCSSNCMYNMVNIKDDNKAKNNIYIVKNNTLIIFLL